MVQCGDDVFPKQTRVDELCKYRDISSMEEVLEQYAYLGLQGVNVDGSAITRASTTPDASPAPGAKLKSPSSTTEAQVLTTEERDDVMAEMDDLTKSGAMGVPKKIRSAAPTPSSKGPATRFTTLELCGNQLR